jgi:ectoine hydroxylase-related dioxygenase (phytanoyl-CoA dioxygenase family)
MDMSELLTAEQVDHYDRLGWLKVDQLVQGDDLTRLRQVVIEADSQGKSRVETKREVYKYRTEDQYTRTFRLSADVWTDYPELLELARQLAPAARQVLHADGVRLYADRLFIKPSTSAGGLPTAWHQDLPKLPFDRRDNVTIWVAVEDIPAEKGPLTFLSGSHRLGPVAAMNYDSDEEMFARLSPYERANMADIVEVPLKAGDATFHAGLTMHRAGANVSTQERLVWSVEYISADTLFNGVPHRGVEGLGLAPFAPFDHPKFPVLA